MPQWYHCWGCSPSKQSNAGCRQRLLCYLVPNRLGLLLTSPVFLCCPITVYRGGAFALSLRYLHTGNNLWIHKMAMPSLVHPKSTTMEWSSFFCLESISMLSSTPMNMHTSEEIFSVNWTKTPFFPLWVENSAYKCTCVGLSHHSTDLSHYHPIICCLVLDHGTGVGGLENLSFLLSSCKAAMKALSTRRYFTKVTWSLFGIIFGTNSGFIWCDHPYNLGSHFAQKYSKILTVATSLVTENVE